MPELAQISIKTAYFRGQELKWICLTGPTDSRHISVTYTRQISSSINEPMSKQDKAVCLDVHSIFVMQK